MSIMVKISTEFIHNHVSRHNRFLDPCVPRKTNTNADGQSNSQENELAHLTSKRSLSTAALSPLQPAAPDHFCVILRPLNRCFYMAFSLTFETCVVRSRVLPVRAMCA